MCIDKAKCQQVNRMITVRATQGPINSWSSMSGTRNQQPWYPEAQQSKTCTVSNSDTPSHSIPTNRSHPPHRYAPHPLVYTHNHFYHLSVYANIKRSTASPKHRLKNQRSNQQNKLRHKNARGFQPRIPGISAQSPKRLFVSK